jgi:hypothetical protein
MKLDPPIDYETGLKLARLRFWRQQPTGKAIADKIEADPDVRRALLKALEAA